MRALPLLALAGLLASGCVAPGNETEASTANATFPDFPPAPSRPFLVQPSVNVSATNASYQPLGTELHPAGNDTYWFVRVWGSQGRLAGYSCDRSFTHVVDIAQREVAIDADVYPYDPDLIRSMVASQVNDGAGCAVTDGLTVNGARIQELGWLGSVWFEVDEDTGVLYMQASLVKWTVEPGQALTLSAKDGEGRAVLVLSVANHGAWPREGLDVTHDGPYW